MMKQKRFLVGIFSLVTITLITVAIILFFPLSAPAKPIVTWTPSSIEETVSPGESKTVTVSFMSSKDINDVTVRVVPEMEPFVQVEPASFSELKEGETIDLFITVSAGQESELGTFDGTIQLRTVTKKGKGTKNMAKPLPVVVNVVANGWNTFVNEEYGYEINYPPTWVIRPTGNLTALSNFPEPGEVNETTLQTKSFFGLYLHAEKNPNLLPINQWFDQFFAGGFSVDPLSRTSVLVDNREAVRIEASEVGGKYVHIYVSNQSDVIEIVYGLFAQQFIDEYETILNSLRFVE